MPNHPKAGDNERRFETLFNLKSDGVALIGKQRFESNEVEISVDQSFEYEGIDYLVEVDSGNMAKLLVGQYVLLNQLRNTNKPAFFLIVHTYKKYNPVRTIRNLRMVNNGLLGGKGIPFGAVHIDTLANWNGGVSGLLKLLESS